MPSGAVPVCHRPRFPRHPGWPGVGTCPQGTITRALDVSPEHPSQSRSGFGSVAWLQSRGCVRGDAGGREFRPSEGVKGLPRARSSGARLAAALPPLHGISYHAPCLHRSFPRLPDTWTCRLREAESSPASAGTAELVAAGTTRGPVPATRCVWDGAFPFPGGYRLVRSPQHRRHLPRAHGALLITAGLLPPPPPLPGNLLGFTKHATVSQLMS